MKNKRQYIIFIIIIALCMAAAGLAFFLYHRRQTQKQTAMRAQETGAFGNAQSQTEQAGAMSPIFRADEISYKGVHYRRNTAVEPILFLGIDRQDSMKQETVHGAAGQSDAVFLLAHRTAEHRVQLIKIPRDTMTPIYLTDLSGNVLGKDIQHLSLAFAYGDGQRQSMDFAKDAVSTLFGGLPVKQVMALNIRALRRATDFLGGIPMRIEEDDLEAADPAFHRGAELVLDGAQAEHFVRYRDIHQNNTALVRMERQTRFIQAFEKRLLERAAADESLVPGLLEQLSEDMVTDMDKGRYLKLVLDLQSGGLDTQDSFLAVPGQPRQGPVFDEFYVDSSGLIELILKVFYQPVE